MYNFPLPCWLSPQTPASTINAISFEELIRRYLYQVNYLTDFSKEIKDELDEFNKKVEQVTADYLQKMYDNGTLKTILQEITNDWFDRVTQLENRCNNFSQYYDETTQILHLEKRL